MSLIIYATTRRLHIQGNQEEGLKLLRQVVLVKQVIGRLQNVTSQKIKECKLNVSTKTESAYNAEFDSYSENNIFEEKHVSDKDWYIALQTFKDYFDQKEFTDDIN